MSGYSDDYKDQKRVEWLRKWVPEDVDVPTVEQYRYTLARARDAEANLKKHRDALRALRGLME